MPSCFNRAQEECVIPCAWTFDESSEGGGFCAPAGAFSADDVTDALLKLREHFRDNGDVIRVLDMADKVALQFVRAFMAQFSRSNARLAGSRWRMLLDGLFQDLRENIDSMQDCVICLDGMDDSQEIFETPCCRKFTHQACHERWMMHAIQPVRCVGCNTGAAPEAALPEEWAEDVADVEDVEFALVMLFINFMAAWYELESAELRVRLVPMIVFLSERLNFGIDIDMLKRMHTGIMLFWVGLLALHAAASVYIGGQALVRIYERRNRR